MDSISRRILVTGGGGYIGSLLTPRLLEEGHQVTVLDGFFYGRAALDPVRDNPRLSLMSGDVCDHGLVENTLSRPFDAVIHLAAISNDPSSELDPELTRRVNLDATRHLMESAKEHGIPRFIYPSSASVYGIKDVEDVTEDVGLEPITLYARLKAEGEDILGALVDNRFCGVSVRSATVCGFAPRLRLDLTINILTIHALTHGVIRVFGGSQMRPNIHIDDVVDFYLLLLAEDAETIRGEAFNISHSNATVLELAEMVRDEIGGDVDVQIVSTDDHRSYHLSAEKALQVLGFEPKRELAQAVRDLCQAYKSGLIPEPDHPRYRNVEYMKKNLEF